MEQKKIKWKTLKIFSIIALIILTLIIIILIVKVIDNSKDENPNLIVETSTTSKSISQNENEKLKGTFTYKENVKYIFDGISKGSMSHKDEEFIFTYVVKGNELKIDFEDELVHDANYTFEIEDNNQLKLIGKEGTTGGEYILSRENE